MNREHTVTNRIVFQGRILEVHNDDIALDDGSTAMREIVRHPGGAAVLLVIDGAVTLVKQFRYAYGEELLEIPAGKIERGTEEDAAVCAARELEEETGYRAKKLESLGVIYPSPGYTDELLRLYLCEDAESVSAHPDEGEYVTTVQMPLEELYRKIDENEIRDAKTAVAVLRYRTRS